MSTSDRDGDGETPNDDASSTDSEESSGSGQRTLIGVIPPELRQGKGKEKGKEGSKGGGDGSSESAGDDGDASSSREETLLGVSIPPLLPPPPPTGQSPAASPPPPPEELTVEPIEQVPPEDVKELPTNQVPTYRKPEQTEPQRSAPAMSAAERGFTQNADVHVPQARNTKARVGTGTFKSVGAPGRPVTKRLAALQLDADAVEPDPKAHESVAAPIPDSEATPGTAQYRAIGAGQKVAKTVGRVGIFLGGRIAAAVRDDHIYLILMAAIVGVSSGVAAALLLGWIERAVRLFPSAEAIGLVGTLVFIGVPAIGGLSVGGLRLFAKRYLNREIPSGVVTVVEAVAQRSGTLDGPTGALIGVGTGLTIGSGGSVGHEGSTVAIGATVGSVLSRFFGLRLRRQVALVGAGCAAGLAAAFNAPLAGVIFTVEVIFRRNVGGNVGTMSVFIPLVVAAVAGTFTSHTLMGARTEFAVDIHLHVSLVEMVFFLALALLAGAISPLMSRLIVYSFELFDKVKVPEWVKPAIGGLGVGLLALIGIFGPSEFTDLLGPGRSTVHAALDSNLAWQIALGLLVLKIVATALTIGSRGVGGFFMPSLFAGACLGILTHALASVVLGSTSPAAGYALVGMGAYLGATMRAPLTPIVMIFELTHDYGLVLPLMFACILSSFMAGKVNELSIYDLLLRKRGVNWSGEDDGDVMHRGRVGDLMTQPDHLLRTDSTFDEVQRAALIEKTPILYVLDGEGRLAGAIDSADLASRIVRGEVDDTSVAEDLITTGKPTLLYQADTLAGSMLAFTRARSEVLPVVDEEGRVIGMLMRHDLLAHYTENVLEQEDAALAIASGARGQDEVGLGRGITLERVAVGRAWAGATLRELDLRKVYKVQVLEWRRAEELLDIDPTEPLREGDVLALAGSRDALLSVRWQI